MENMTQELDEIKKMLTTLLRHEGCLQFVNRWAYGQNEGGRYVSLFNDRLAYRICAVYGEQFKLLPQSIQDAIPSDCGGEISTERSRVEKTGRLLECPPMWITRYAVGSGDDLKWRFSNALWQSGGGNSAPQDKPAPEPQTPTPHPEASPAIEYATPHQVTRINELAKALKPSAPTGYCGELLRHVNDKWREGKPPARTLEELTTQEAQTLLKGMVKKQTEMGAKQTQVAILGQNGHAEPA